VSAKTSLARPRIDRWYRPDEDGQVSGIILWRGEVGSGISESQICYVLKVANGEHVAVREWARLRPLRFTRRGQRVYIAPLGKKDLGDGRSLWNFDLHVRIDEEPAAK
jgi:hypothetical protein